MRLFTVVFMFLVACGGNNSKQMPVPNPNPPVSGSPADGGVIVEEERPCPSGQVPCGKTCVVGTSVAVCSNMDPCDKCSAPKYGRATCVESVCGIECNTGYRPENKKCLPVEQILVLSPLADTYISSAHPGTLDSSYMTDTLLSVSDTERTFVEFDLSQMPGTYRIQSAELSIYQTGGHSEELVPLDVMAYEKDKRLSVAQTWTWNDHGPHTNRLSSVYSRLFIGDIAGFYRWDVKDVVQSWLKAHPGSEYVNFVVKSDEEPIDVDWHNFVANECVGFAECVNETSLTLTISPPF